MDKLTSSVRLADAVMRWVVAGRMKDAMVRKQNASAMAAMLDNGPQDFHEEESEFFSNEYKEAEKLMREMLVEYASISPESMPKYPEIKLSKSQKLTLESMDWLAKASGGAMRL